MADNQDFFFDDQNFNIDVNKIYKDFITEVDSIRSHTNLTTIDIAGDLDNSAIKLTVNDKPQESRCHAFYRLIGLPVLSADGSSMYSPGFFQPDNGNDEKVKKKIGIGKSLPNGLKMLNFLREILYPNYQQIFSVQSIESSVLALSSINFRGFAAPVSKSDDPFDQTPTSYTVSNSDIYGSLFSSYVDDNAVPIPASSKALNFSRTHIIKPLMVFAPIELTVLPAKNLVCVPFVADKSQTLISSEPNIFARRPFIEFVCRTRFDGRNKIDSLSEAQTKTINFIKGSDTFKDLDIINSISQGVGSSATDQAQFIKIFNTIRAMNTKLHKAIDDIVRARSETLWIPVPNKNGPEFGSTTRDLVPNDPNNTDNDNKIINKVFTKRFNQITGTLSTTKKDLGEYALGKIQVFPDNSSGLGDNNSEDLDHLIEGRNDLCNKANEALKTIEIIMGEFSGLGFCDIVALNGALWLMDKKDLVGLMDKDAQNRMKLVPELSKDPDLASPSSGATAIKNFEKKIKELYELMAKSYDDISQNNQNAYTSQ